MSGGRVVSIAAIIACGVNQDGRREILGLGLGESEAQVFWVEFLRNRAMKNVLHAPSPALTPAVAPRAVTVAARSAAALSRCPTFGKLANWTGLRFVVYSKVTYKPTDYDLLGDWC